MTRDSLSFKGNKRHLPAKPCATASLLASTDPSTELMEIILTEQFTITLVAGYRYLLGKTSSSLAEIGPREREMARLSASTTCLLNPTKESP